MDVHFSEQSFLIQPGLHPSAHSPVKPLQLPDAPLQFLEKQVLSQPSPYVPLGQTVRVEWKDSQKRKLQVHETPTQRNHSIHI
jgi:hypothetical protein